MKNSNPLVRKKFTELGMLEGLHEEDLDVFVDIMDCMGKNFTDYEDWKEKDIQNIWDYKDNKKDIDLIVQQVKKRECEEYESLSKATQKVLEKKYPFRYAKYSVLTALEENNDKIILMDRVRK
jgi:hypothetical protein